MRTSSFFPSFGLASLAVACAAQPPDANEEVSTGELTTPCRPGTREIGGTHVGDVVFAECTLTANRAISIQGSLTLLAGTTLTITPIDRTLVDPTWTMELGEYYPPQRELDVTGSLIAEGTAAAPIAIIGAQRNAWIGVRVAGEKNRIAQLRVANAELGLTLGGVAVPIRHLTTEGSRRGLLLLSSSASEASVEDYSGGALAFNARGGRAHARRVHVDVSRTPGWPGIDFSGVEAHLEDAVVVGGERPVYPVVDPWFGGVVTRGAPATIERSFVTGFRIGVLHLMESAELVVTDTTLVGNGAGIVTHRRREPPRECEPPPPPTRPDPRVTHSEITGNIVGIDHRMRGVLTVEDSSILRNTRAGIMLSTSSVHPDSLIARSNLADNGAEQIVEGALGRPAQVISEHVVGSITLRDDFWGMIPLECGASADAEARRAFTFRPPSHDADCPWVPPGSHVCFGFATAPITSAGVRTAVLTPEVTAARARFGK